jgi:phosphoglycerate dehydrogenase-like enzyme
MSGATTRSTGTRCSPRALDANALAGAALDVPSPDLLPAGHALFGRRDVLLTPHLSGRTVEFWERAVDVFEANLARCKTGEKVWNRIDFERSWVCVHAVL